MTIEQLLTDTKRKWKKIIKTLKRNKPKQGSVSPINTKITVSCSSYAGTVDARDEISVERFQIFSTRPDEIESLPPFPVANENFLEPRPMSYYENSTFSYDSAYDTDQSRKSSMYDHTFSSDIQNMNNTTRDYRREYCCSCDKEDCTSITTETTWLEYDVTDGMENKQNVLNERIELITSL